MMNASDGDCTRPRAAMQFPFHMPSTLQPSLGRFRLIRLASFLAASLMVVAFGLGGIFALPRFLPKPPVFPALCSGNFQSANTSANTTTVRTPPTGTSPDGEQIGLSEGATIFDLQRPNPNEVQDKLQSAEDITTNFQSAESLLKNASSIDQTDAEAKIYLEDSSVLESSRPHITIVVGVSFASIDDNAVESRSDLQGAFTAQKECNDQSQSNGSKTQIVLMIANIGGIDSNARANSAKFVADQMADQAAQDKTIVGIMGWPNSADSINLNHQLKIRGSHLPMVSSTSSSDELEGMSNFFRVCPPNSEEALIAANFLLNTKQKKRIVVLYDSTTSYSNNLKKDFAKDIPNNIVGSPVPFTGGQPDTLQSALTIGLARNPDALFFSGYVSDLDTLLKAISRTSSAHLLIVGGDALATTDDYPTPLPDLRNVYFAAFGSPNQWDGIEPKPPFFHDYQTNFRTDRASNGLPSINVDAMLGYDGISMLLYGSEQVLSTKNMITPSDLTQALQQITVANPIQGLTGRIAFGNNGNQDQSKIIFMEHIEGTNLVIDETQGCLQKDNCSS